MFGKDKAALVMSGGTEGGLSPHILVFEVDDSADGDASVSARETKRASMAVGSVSTPPMLPEEIGTAAQIASVADGVTKAMARALIDSVEDIHFVQVKCPLLTAERIAHAAKPTVTTDTIKSMGVSRGASALGVCVALGEMTVEEAETALRSKDTSRFSSVASASAVRLSTIQYNTISHSVCVSACVKVSQTIWR